MLKNKHSEKLVRKKLTNKSKKAIPQINSKLALKIPENLIKHHPLASFCLDLDFVFHKTQKKLSMS